MSKKFKLRNLKIGEGSLVDRGANPEAAVVLFKRDTNAHSGEDTLQATAAAEGGEEVKAEKQMTENTTSTPEVTSTPKEGEDMSEDMEKADPQVEQLKAKIAELEAKIVELSKSDEPAEADITKGMSEDVRKAFDEMQEKVDAAEAIAKVERDARIEKDFASKAELYPYVGDAADVAQMLKVASEVSAEHGEMVEKTLASANERIEKGDLFAEVGRGGSDSDSDPERKLDELAKAYAKSEGVTIEKAYSEVTKTAEGKALLNERSE